MSDTGLSTDNCFIAPGDGHDDLCAASAAAMHQARNVYTLSRSASSASSLTEQSMHGPVGQRTKTNSINTNTDSITTGNEANFDLFRYAGR